MTTASFDTRVANLSDALHRELVSVQTHCWLLIDPILRPLQEASPLACLLLERPSYRVQLHGGIDPSLTPLLIAFDPAKASDHDLVWHSLQEALAEMSPDRLSQGGGRRVCGWLQSTLDGQHLARHIATHMLHSHSNTRRCWLRWHDPAVLWVLWSLLTAAQQAQLLGPVSRYHLLDPAGHWRRLDGNQRSQGQTLEFEHAQWQDISAIASLNKVLRDLTRPSLTPGELDSLRDNGLAALRRARQLGFADRHDLAAFVRLALTVHRSFDTHPLVAKCLSRRRPGEHFTALIDDLGAAHWAEVRQEMGAQAPPRIQHSQENDTHDRLQ